MKPSSLDQAMRRSLQFHYYHQNSPSYTKTIPFTRYIENKKNRLSLDASHEPGSSKTRMKTMLSTPGFTDVGNIKLKKCRYHLRSCGFDEVSTKISDLGHWF